MTKTLRHENIKVRVTDLMFKLSFFVAVFMVFPIQYDRYLQPETVSMFS